MDRSPLTVRSAVMFSIGISVLMHALIGLMFLYGRNMFVPPEGGHTPPQRVFDYTRLAVSFVSTFLLSFILYLLNYRLIRSKMEMRLKIFLIVILSLAACIFLSTLLSYSEFRIFDAPRGRHWRGGGFGLMRDLFIAAIVVFSSQLLYISWRRQQMALDYETLVAENIRTRFEALKNQVDPHFLFNSLNTLNSVIKTDPEKAQEYVHKLSQVFRYTLQNNETITLEEELEFTKAYCSLMQIRYGESLSFDFRIDPKYREYTIIPLSVQTLVENAIKHNIISNKQPLVISIATNPDNSLTVSNKLQAKKTKAIGSGIGLSNLTERYKLLWNAEIGVMEKSGYFEVTIPLIEQDRT